MGRLIEIPLFNLGLMTQPDPEDVPLGGCTAIENFEVDKHGVLYKRQGRKSVGDPTDVLFSQVMKWVNANFTGGAFDGTAWITYDTTNDTIFYYDKSWTGKTTIKDLVSGVADIKILNFGDKLRFANALTKKAGVFQYISRDYFWNSALKTTAAFVYDDVAPKDEEIVYASITPSTSTTGGTLAADTYYYKIVVVFDGNQEAVLPADYISQVTTGATSKNTIKYVLDTIATNYNTRITAFKIYRGLDWGGPYYHIVTIGAIDADADPHMIYMATAYSGGYGLFDPERNWTPGGLSGLLIIGDSQATIAGNTKTTIKTSGRLGANSPIWGDYYSIWSGAIRYKQGFEDGTVDGWAAVSGDPVSNSGTAFHSGSKSLRAPHDAGVAPGDAQRTITGLTELTTHTVQMWVRSLSGASQVITVSLDGTVVDAATTGATWVKLTGTAATGVADTDMVVKVYGNSTATGIYVDDIVLSSGTLSEEHSTGYAGRNTVVSDDLNLDIADGYKDWRVLVGTNANGNNDASAPEVAVTKNHAKVLKVGSDFATGYSANNARAYLSRYYMWQKSGTTNVQLTVYDDGITSGARHPLDAEGIDKIEVNYTYAQYIDGRLYCLDVRLDPDTEAEDHKNWIMFSELLQPDVIPITNYIEIEDLQGESPVGLAEMLGDLVIFMEQGIHRLRIPSSNPAQWSTREVVENVGCVSPNSIVSAHGILFFAGTDHIYALAPDFRAIPITGPLKDTYQGQSNLDTTRIVYDPNKGRLLCRFGDLDATIYAFDLVAFLDKGQIIWHQIKLVGTNVDTVLAVDQNNLVYTLTSVTPDTTVEELYPSSGGTESFSTKWKSGWIPISDLGKRNSIRRLNARYLSADAITAKIYTDGDDTTALLSTTLALNTGASDKEYVTRRVARRGRYCMIELTTPATATYNTKIRRLELEVDD